MSAFPAIMRQRAAAEYVGGEKLLRILEAEFGLAPLVCTRRWKRYSRTELEEAVDRLRHSGKSVLEVDEEVAA